MVSNSRDKIIQVQKPAQSLQAFQQKVATGQAERASLLKPMLIAAGAAVVVCAGIFGFRAWRGAAIERHEADLAALEIEVLGDGSAPVPPAELEQRMRAKLPALEALVAKAPGSERASTAQVLASWKLMLDGKGGVAPDPQDAWGKIQAAQRAVAMGKGQEALNALASLRKGADPATDWAPVFWSTLLDADRLLGDRTAALKDLSDYKGRFKTQADPAVEGKLNGI